MFGLPQIFMIAAERNPHEADMQCCKATTQVQLRPMVSRAIVQTLIHRDSLHDNVKQPFRYACIFRYL